MVKPNFSIIIIAETVSENLKACIDNINKFTTLPYEIIIVHTGPNNPNDKNIDLMQYKHISCYNMNISSAYNSGLKLSEGDNLVILSSKITVSANWDRDILNCTKLSQNIGLVGQAKRNTKMTKTKSSTSNIVENLDEDFLLIKRKVLDSIGNFDEIFSSIHFMFSDFFLRARLAGFELLHCNENYIGKRYNEPLLDKIEYLDVYQIDRKKFVNKWEKILPIKDDLISEILNKLPPKAIGEELLFLGDNPIIPNTLINRGYNVSTITCHNGYSILQDKEKLYDIIIFFDNFTHESSLIRLLRDGGKILNQHGLIIINIFNALFIERIHQVFKGNFSIASLDINRKYPIQCLSMPEIMASGEIAEMELMYLVGFASNLSTQYQKLFKEICKTNSISKSLKEEICIEEYLAIWQKNK